MMEAVSTSETSVKFYKVSPSCCRAPVCVTWRYTTCVGYTAANEKLHDHEWVGKYGRSHPPPILKHNLSVQLMEKRKTEEIRVRTSGIWPDIVTQKLSNMEQKWWLRRDTLLCSLFYDAFSATKLYRTRHSTTGVQLLKCALDLECVTQFRNLSQLMCVARGFSLFLRK
jgi:hypothetical protein